MYGEPHEGNVEVTDVRHRVPEPQGVDERDQADEDRQHRRPVPAVLTEHEEGEGDDAQVDPTNHSGWATMRAA
jgi:hypothetical protein